MALDPAPGKAIVLYDGNCPLCRRSVPILRWLDWRGVLAFQSARDRLPPAHVPLDPERLLEEMHVLTPDRRRALAGFRAFRWLAWRLPPTLPLAPLAYLPGALWLGNKLYLWLARNRMNLVPCGPGGCAVPLNRQPPDPAAPPAAQTH